MVAGDGPLTITLQSVCLRLPVTVNPQMTLQLLGVSVMDKRYTIIKEIEYKRKSKG